MNIIRKFHEAYQGNKPISVDGPVDRSGWKQWDFVGTKKWNAKHSYRAHALTLQDAINEIVTGYDRIRPDDIQLVKCF